MRAINFCKDDIVYFSIANGGTIFISGIEYTVTYINSEYFMLDLKTEKMNDFMTDCITTGKLLMAGNGLISGNFSSNYERFNLDFGNLIYLPDIKKACLFSDLRIIPNSIPAGYVVRNIRDTHEYGDSLYSLEDNVWVDHIGSVVFPVDPLYNNRIELNTINFNYTLDYWREEAELFCLKNGITLDKLAFIHNNEATWLLAIRDYMQTQRAVG